MFAKNKTSLKLKCCILKKEISFLLKMDLIRRYYTPYVETINDIEIIEIYTPYIEIYTPYIEITIPEYMINYKTDKKDKKKVSECNKLPTITEETPEQTNN